MGKLMCGGCNKRWTGFKMCHCASCHETFSTEHNFDRHRKKKSEAGGCIPPADVGLVCNSRGTWKMPGEKDISEIHQKREA
jgi:hypothetical protein